MRLIRRLVVLIAAPPVLVSILTLMPTLTLLLSPEAAPIAVLGLPYEGAVAAFFEVGAYAGLCALAFAGAYLVSGIRTSPHAADGAGIPASAPASGRGPTRMPEMVGRRIVRPTVLAALAMTALGCAVIVATVSPDYIRQMLSSFTSGLEARNLIYGREGFSFSGRTPGIVRMLHYGVISAIVMLLGVVLAVRPLPRPTRLAYYVAMSIGYGGAVFDMLMVGNRTPMLACAALGLYVLVLRSRGRVSQGARTIRIILVGVLIVGSLGLVGVVDSLRGVRDGGSTSVVVSYAAVCASDAYVVMGTTTRFSFGFSSFLGPIGYFSRGVGLSLDYPVADSALSYDPAGCLLSRSYKDFGYAGFVIYALFGWMARSLRMRVRTDPTNLGAHTNYLWLLVGLATIWTMPIFQGPDFWAGALLTALGVMWVRIAAGAGWHWRGIVNRRVPWGRFSRRRRPTGPLTASTRRTG